MKRRFPLLKLILFTLASVVLVFELGLRFVSVAGWSKEDLRPDFLKTQAEARAVGHPYLGYALKPGWRSKPDDPMGQKSQNADGYRGPLRPRKKPAGTYRIACIGGSSTYGSTPSSDATTWPAQLELLLNERTDTPVEVLNFGVFGYTTFEILGRLAFHAVDYEPDLVIVYETINDMRCALYTRGGPPQPDNTHWRAVWPLYSPSPGEQLLENSMLYLNWRARFTGYLARFQSVDAYAIVNYDAKDPDPYFRGDLKEVALGFETFARNLKSIAAVAHVHGARVMLATQGCDRQDIGAGSRENQWAGLDYNGTLLRVVHEQLNKPPLSMDTLFVDARAALESAWAEHAAEVRQLERKAQPFKTSDPAKYREMLQAPYDLGVFTGEVHLTDKGARLLARTFADAIVAEELLGR